MKKNNFCTKALLLFLGCWLLLLTAMPANADTTTIKSVLQELSRVKSSKAEFIETKILSLLDNKIELSGTLEYIAPDTIIRKTIKPQTELFKISGDKLYMVKANGEQHRLLLSNYPVIAVFTEAYRSVLAGNLRKLNEFYDTSFKTQGGQWTISLIPFDDEALEYVDSIQVMGTGNHIHSVTTVESGGDKTIMQIKADKQVF